MTKCVRTAIFGGTFNPIHNGHVAIARKVVETGLADELWLMVTPQNPWKRDMSLMADQFRLRLAQMAVDDIDGVEASDYEFHLPRPSYTADTLRSLVKAYPERKFSLVIGADNWSKFDKWYDNGYILENYPLIVYSRNGYPLPKATTGNVTFPDWEVMDISSTDIRSRMSEGLPIDSLVPEATLELLRPYQANSIR